MYQKSNERAQRASEISDTNNECENSVQAPCPWSNLFISYILSEHFFFLFRKTSLYLEKMTSEFKKQGPAQTKCHKKCIIRWTLQMLWVKILTKNRSKMKYNLPTQDSVYDDDIIKWPLKHRIVLSIKKLWQKLVTEMVQQAGCPHRMSRELAWCVSITINSNSNYKLTQKIIEFLWLNLFYFSAFLLGFQKLREKANISSSFQQRLSLFSVPR